MKNEHLAILLMASMAVIGANPVNATTTHHLNYNTISASGMNTCGEWYHTSGTFKNYCPFCHRSGVMEWNPKGVADGEWTCGHCDADYCICGRCKAGGSGVYLIPATIAPKKTTQTPANFQSPVSGLQKAINCLTVNKTVLGAI